MKIASFVVTVVGVLALILGGVERVFHFFILQIAPRTYMGIAAVMFLLALVLIEYDRAYCAGKKQQ
jgi:hypothetical protein